jgi:hypothetical protein
MQTMTETLMALSSQDEALTERRQIGSATKHNSQIEGRVT